MSDAFIDAVKMDDVQGAKQYVFDTLQVKIADSFNNITSDAISAFQQNKHSRPIHMMKQP